MNSEKCQTSGAEQPFMDDLKEEELISIHPKTEAEEATELDLIKKHGFYLNYECEDETSFGSLEPNEKHTVLFDHSFLKSDEHSSPPAPTSDIYVDKWNNDFVKLPFSSYNLNEKRQSVWEIIKKTLNKLSEILAQDPHSIHFETAIRKIYSNYEDNNCNFDAFHNLIKKLERVEKNNGEKLLAELIPKIIKLALDLPEKIKKPIPILKSGKSHSISMSQEQCASILANAFFCTFPERTANSNPKNLPFINFKNLFHINADKMKSESRKIEKLRCILNYFQRVTSQMPTGVITFSRQFLADEKMPNFRKSTKEFNKVLIKSEGTIEDCNGAIQQLKKTKMDFANKYLGGGVLNYGCVQEEIRFAICPELMVSMLFSERLDKNETFMIKGCERFSSYTGYAETFEWTGDFTDKTNRDKWCRFYTHVLAVDALNFRYPRQQFEEANVVRELRKCYSGFKNETKTASSENKSAAIATGNWGCGAFNGERQIKFVIQMMAAAEADRDLIYFTFNHESTTRKLFRIMNIIKEKNLNVGQVYSLLNKYADEVRTISDLNMKKFGLVEFLETELAY